MAAAFPERWRAGLLACPLGIRRLACGGHLALIALLSLMPAWLFPPSDVSIPGVDKIVHLAMYGWLGVLLRWEASREGGRTAGNGHLTGAIGYGLLMEVLQLLVGAAERLQVQQVHGQIDAAGVVVVGDVGNMQHGVGGVQHGLFLAGGLSGCQDGLWLK